ncbi:MAG TPA: hypothetical protein VHG28_22295, partial [Longimicrobiaceae bacterium]|nr:hypothetical protein [Longimicrobiaceae bacterium]
ESRGDFENALLLFQALRSRDFPPAERLLLEAGLARAAAGAGNAQLFEDVWSATWTRVAGLPDSECPAGVLIQLAHGALIRGHHDLGEQAALRALTIASDRGEAHDQEMAEKLVEAAQAASRTRARMAAQRAPGHDARTAHRLARGFASALRGGAAQGIEPRAPRGT